jgi:hypothetical protein
MNDTNLVYIEKGKVMNPHGRPKGSLNRSTVYRQWLELLTTAEVPETGEIIELTIMDKVVLKQIEKALKGNTKSFNALMDGAFGRIQGEAPIIEEGKDYSINMEEWK